MAFNTAGAAYKSRYAKAIIGRGMLLEIPTASNRNANNDSDKNQDFALPKRILFGVVFGHVNFVRNG